MGRGDQEGREGRTKESRIFLTILTNLAVLASFAALTLLFTRPLISHLTTAVAGGAGDNLLFLWNFWWAQTAAAT
ncbi:MAG TPA: hypothetical protein VHZ73_05880, partial [Vicinamibacterales bacterium]|nr:hypothetical protein [Vicinamibacterales bacterium]